MVHAECHGIKTDWAYLLTLQMISARWCIVAMETAHHYHKRIISTALLTRTSLMTHTEPLIVHVVLMVQGTFWAICQALLKQISDETRGEQKTRNWTQGSWHKESSATELWQPDNHQPSQSTSPAQVLLKPWIQSPVAVCFQIFSSYASGDPDVGDADKM